MGTIDYTKTTGINLAGSPSIFQFSGSLAVSYDTKGNIAIQGTAPGGLTGGSPSASVTAFTMRTNAPSVRYLEGTGYQVGGSIGAPVYGIPLSGGAEINIIPDATNNKSYYGITTSAGFGTPGGEVHVEWGETKTFYNINVFDVMESIYQGIMGW